MSLPTNSLPPQQNFVTATCRQYNQIRRTLCDLLRRQNSAEETKIFTKILPHKRRDLSLLCVASLRSKRFRLERPRNGIVSFGRARNGTTANFRTEMVAAQARWQRNVLLQLLPPRPGACEKALQEQTLSQDLSS